MFEIHTSKLTSKWSALYLLHNCRQVRKREGEQGDEGSITSSGMLHCPRSKELYAAPSSLRLPCCSLYFRITLADAGAPADQGLS